MKRVLKVLGWLVGIVIVLIGGLVVFINATWDNPHERAASTRMASMDSATISRGEFLFKYGNTCWGCHSATPHPDAPPSGGRPFDLTNVGPGFGMFYTPNITPDNETGIGSWTDGEIVRAIREGIRHDGKPLFPLMPMATLKGLSDDDVFAIVSYLRSIPPVNNKVTPHDIRFPTKMLFALGVVGPEPPITEPIPTPARSVTPEYGQYLAKHAALCSDCHTPRNLNDGSFYFDSLFAGSSISFGQIEGDPIWAYATNITPDAETGIGNWTEEQFLLAVRTGTRPDGRVLVTHMPYAEYGLWDEDDLRAIYLYLKSVPPIKRTAPPVHQTEQITQNSGIERGKAIFSMRCRACHGENGTGAPATNAKMSELAPTIDDKTLKEFISAGQVSLRMPGFGKTLSDEEMNDVIAFIRSWQQ
ncbi:MAG: c-type cytochrome [Ignavibacteriae bacterium]|nr:c-type cytochrome [Ignavibacteriota bacterium]MCI0707908.1 c-type cytochrome [Ignavibacteriota bacterium]